METINGITFEDWAAASANLAAGMSEKEVVEILGIEGPVWEDTNKKWTDKLGDLMASDMSVATKYGEIFSNPKVGKFASGKSIVVGIEELLKIVPDYDTYQKVLIHQSVASDHGIDPVSVMEIYGLNHGSWATLSSHYSKEGLGVLTYTDPDYNEKRLVYKEMVDKWQKHWEEHFKKDSVDLGGDIDF